MTDRINKRRSVLPIGWELLEGTAEDQIWKRFARSFNFLPSVHKSEWPGISERAPFLTYKLPPLKTLNQPDIWLQCLRVFQIVCSRPGQERLAVLDWQHQSYWLDPKTAGETSMVPIIPNGDYYIFIEPQLRYGIFGHPWEWTISVFGVPLLSAWKKQNFTKDWPILRQQSNG